jgi:tetratricopeptide (TPR) repeat protein
LGALRYHVANAMRTALSTATMIVAIVSGNATQLRVSSPYLDIVERYRAGDHARAVDELKGIAVAGIRERARRDLTELPCQVLTGIADCTRAREQKPAEFERVVEVWTTTLPAAAALHIDAAVAAQKAGRDADAPLQQRAALDLADLIVTAIPSSAPGLRDRVEVRRAVWLLSTWLLQLRLDRKDLEMLLTRARQTFPSDALVRLASGAFHEVQARPYLLLESSEGRQGNVAAWRLEERTWRLKSAEAGFREAIGADPTLAEAHLRLGRVLTLQGRRDEAHVALARAAELTSDARWRYLALLFRAAAYEAAGDAAAAEPSYRGALTLWPTSHAARVGLSRMRAERAAWDEARTELEGISLTAPETDDPWWAYDFGQAWRIESALADLRKQVSR